MCNDIVRYTRCSTEDMGVSIRSASYRRLVGFVRLGGVLRSAWRGPSFGLEGSFVPAVLTSYSICFAVDISVKYFFLFFCKDFGSCRIRLVSCSRIMCILCSVVISALVMMYTSEHATETLLQQLCLFLCGVDSRCLAARYWTTPAYYSLHHAMMLM